MVEMSNKNMYCRTVIRLMLGALLLASGAALAQQPRVEPRIAGLEGNEEYMSLLREDAALRMREDSVMLAVERLRGLLREEPDRRQSYSQEILRLEGQIFDIRNAKGRLIDRINTIEQEWVLANLNNETSVQVPLREDPGVSIPDSLKVRNLVDNLYFRSHLPESDYAALLESQRLETRAGEYAERILSNHTTLSDLVDAYASVETESEALEIYARYDSLQQVNARLADSLHEAWTFIFDNKNYAYGYVLDVLGAEDLLTREEEALAKTVRRITSLRGETASDALTDYLLRKRMLVGYEAAVADLLTLDAARDSLQGVASVLEGMDFQLPRLAIRERYFLDFDSVAFSSTPKYSTQHPIPECKVYANGTIYRILLGTFNTKRAVSTFRGAYPLFYLINEDNKWCYYTGGFATLAEAEEAQARLKKHGFIRPEIVVWTDGAARNLSRDPEPEDTAFRVEITGAEALSDAVKEAISSLAEGCELSRVGQLFIVGSFHDRAVADRLAEAIRQADPSLNAEVTAIGQ